MSRDDAFLPVIPVIPRERAVAQEPREPRDVPLTDAQGRRHHALTGYKTSAADLPSTVEITSSRNTDLKMFKLVVLSALLAFAAAAPHIAVPIAAPAPVAYAAPAVQAYSYSTSSQVVHAAPAAVAYSAPVVHAAPAPVAYSAPVVHAAPAVAYSAPVVHAAPVATAITKTVHYESKPVVTGYTSTVIKPDLGHLHTPAAIVSQQKVLAPARSVQTITPQITQVQPELTIQKVAVDVPVHTPYVSEVEVRTPTVVAQPAVAYSAPAVAYHAAPAPVAYHAAPAVHYKTVAAPAPVAYHAAPAVHYKTVGAPAIAYNQW